MLEKSKTNNLSLYFKKLEKSEQSRPNISRKSKTIKEKS